MELIRGIHNIRARHRGCAVTLGAFDGLHYGHQMLLGHLCAKSEELAVSSMLITFEPHPREFLRPDNPPSRLSCLREKWQALQSTDLDHVLVLKFDARTQSIPAIVVVENFLVQQLGIRHLVVGDDFRFGKDAEGNYSMLAHSGERFGFGVTYMGTLVDRHARVSSTRIRESLADGVLEEAEHLLGRPYSMTGRVVRGLNLGAKLGVPTANIRPGRLVSPLRGIFAVVVSGLDREYSGVASIGTRPTLGGVETLLEVHLLDFSADIYCKILTVEFHKKLRDEIKYESLEALKAQMHRDIEAAKECLKDKRILGHR